MRLRIATRKSPLALWQAEHVKAAIRALRPDLEVSLVERVTKGDKILDQALSKVGGKDLFVKEIEDALLTGEAELAVHSLKDVPTALPAGLSIAAFPPREDPRDALVSHKGYRLSTLPKGAVVGTSSLRRAAQLKIVRPDLQIVPIRGNVQTRLERSKKEGMDATVLAWAGLVRLGLGEVATEVLEVEVSLPAIGQGILAVEAKDDDASTRGILAPLDDASARTAAIAERAFLRRLEGGCQVPIAGYATIQGQKLMLRGLVSELDGSKSFRGNIEGPIADAERLGTALAEELLGQGAGAVLARLKAAP
ncbi:MAG: hydroxymethylbilane synthase [Myxococcota bacterium]